MNARTSLALLVAAAGLGFAGCSEDNAANSQGALQLIEFLESGKDSIPRNRELTFVFSAQINPVQDFAERLKVINIQSGQGASNFARAIGLYSVVGERVIFTPRLPENEDRSDAGMRADGNYHVFLKGGPDGLRSMDGDVIAFQQEFTFDTSEFFEDPSPSEPPRVLGLMARDATTGQTFDISRLDPRPLQLAIIDNDDLASAGRIIEPGTPSSAPQYDTTWQFDLEVSEPIDPATVNTDNIQMFEIRNDALETAEGLPLDQQGASAGYFGDPVNFRVPVTVQAVQELTAGGPQRYFVRVTTRQTLVDDARYRLIFSGNILGIDFRQTFIGENGLTGDGATNIGLAGAGGSVFPEPGGLGYTTELLVSDQFAIRATKALTYDQREDGIFPELGNTTLDENLFNSALYNPASDPGRAVGFLSAFGQGTDGPLAVSTGATLTIDTGDTPNDFVGNPFSVQDINPNDEYDADTRPGGLVTYDSVEPFEMQLESLTVSNSSTLEFTGVNPVLLRVQGLVQVNGTIDVNGGRGANGGGGISAAGAGGPGGWPGGASRRPSTSCTLLLSNCPDFNTWLSQCGGASGTGFHTSDNGTGPGRGMAGGDTFCYPSGGATGCNTSTGGGGASHATLGTEGEDITSANAADGSKGNCLSGATFAVKNSGRVGIRGTAGPTYGDRLVIAISVGGSGGGAGGSMHLYSTFSPGQDPGGSGGGGGGSLQIISAGAITAVGGAFLARGGDGGNGSFANWNNQSTNRVSTGGGGGGSGGIIVLISGDELILTTALLDTRGGVGGLRATAGASISCNNCNAGGAGGKGFIFLMDADGDITGFLPGQPGNYDGFTNGVLTISRFEADRFSTISAITELFSMPAADPDYEQIAEGDVLAFVNPGQTVVIFASSAKADLANPLRPDITSEIASFEVVEVSFAGGAGVVTVTGDMTSLNPAAGAPNRDAFVRIRVVFDYTDGVEAALGPFASIDEVVITFQFNGVIN